MKKYLWMKYFKEDYKKLCGKKHLWREAVLRIIYNFRMRYLFLWKNELLRQFLLKENRKI